MFDNLRHKDIMDLNHPLWRIKFEINPYMATFGLTIIFMWCTKEGVPFTTTQQQVALIKAIRKVFVREGWKETLPEKGTYEYSDGKESIAVRRWSGNKIALKIRDLTKKM